MIVGSENEVFTWKVFAEYMEEENEVNDGMGHFYPEIFIQGRGEYKEYRPAEYPGLYVEVQRVNDKKTAMEFIKKFGLPDSPEYAALKWVLSCAKNVRECLRLYNAIKGGMPLQGIELEELTIRDGHNLHEKLKRFSKEKVRAMEIEKWTQIVLEASKDIGKYRTQDQGREALMEHINKHLEGVRPVLLFKENSFIFGQTCNSLSQFIYLQLFENISQKKKFSQCQECFSWFVPTKAGMNFCPPLPWEKKSRCANRFYVRKHDQEHPKTKKREVSKNGRQS